MSDEPRESWQSARARLATYARRHGLDDRHASGDLRAARAEEYLAKVIAQAPPLTPEQAERLRQLLPPRPRLAPIITEQLPEAVRSGRPRGGLVGAPDPARPPRDH